MVNSGKTGSGWADKAPESATTIACLNCGETVSSKFCPDCGQSATTRRFSYRHPLGTSSQGGSVFDIPFLYTIGALISRPGFAVGEILQGKRLRYARVSSVLVIFLLVDNFIQNHSGFQFSDIFQETDGIVNTLLSLRKTNPKLFLLTTIPLQAVFSYLIFTGTRLNYIEHLYLNAYRNVGQLLIGILFSLATLFTNNTVLLTTLNTVLVIPRLLYDFCFYFQLLSTYDFSLFSKVVRSVLATISLIVVLTVVTMVFL